MKQSYYLFSSGEVQRKDNSITISKEDGSTSDIPVERIYDLYTFGEMRYNSACFSFLGSKGIPVHMFNYYDFYTGACADEFCPSKTNHANTSNSDSILIHISAKGKSVSAFPSGQPKQT